MGLSSTAASRFSRPVLTERRIWWCFAVGLLALGALIYAPARHFEFLNFDDPVFVAQNPWLQKGLTWASWRWAWQANLVGHSAYAEYWSPLTLLSRLLEAHWFGMNAGAFHLDSVLIHLVNAALLALALRQLTGNAGRSVMVALLFLVQAQTVEAVCWLSARKDLLNATFYLATLLAYGWYARRQTRARYAAVLLAYAACLMAKPMGVTLPFLLLILDFWPLRRWSEEGASRQGQVRLVAEKIPLMLMAVMAAGLALTSQADWSALANGHELALSIRVENAFLSYALYLRRIFWPDDLAFYYPHPWATLTWVRAVPAALLLTAVTIGAWCLRRRAPMVLAGWLWFGLLLAPVIGLVQIGSQAMADRYVYLAAVGPLVALVWLLAEHAPARWQWAIALVALGSGTLFTARQTLLWRSDETLYPAALAATERNWMAELNLGRALLADGHPRQAKPRLEAAMQIAPGVAEGWTKLAQTEIALGHDREAIHHLATFLQLEPKDTHSMLLIGLLEERLGEPARAEAALLQMKQVDPSAPAASQELGRLYARQGAWEKAAAAWADYLQLHPGDLEAERSRGEAARHAQALTP